MGGCSDFVWQWFWSGRLLLEHTLDSVVLEQPRLTAALLCRFLCFCVLVWAGVGIRAADCFAVHSFQTIFDVSRTALPTPSVLRTRVLSVPCASRRTMRTRVQRQARWAAAVAVAVAEVVEAAAAIRIGAPGSTGWTG